MGGMGALDDSLEEPTPEATTPSLHIVQGGQSVQPGNDLRNKVSSFGKGRLHPLTLSRLGITVLVQDHVFVEHANECWTGKTMSAAVRKDFEEDAAAIEKRCSRGELSSEQRDAALLRLATQKQIGMFWNRYQAMQEIAETVDFWWEKGLHKWFDLPKLAETSRVDQFAISNFCRSVRKAAPIGAWLEPTVKTFTCHRISPRSVVGMVLEYSRAVYFDVFNKRIELTPAHTVRMVVERIDRRELERRKLRQVFDRRGRPATDEGGAPVMEIPEDFELPHGEEYALLVKAAYPVIPREEGRNG